jgi:hypothetical protein
MAMTLDDETFAAIEAVLASSDALVTAVINGVGGQQKAALDVARALGDLRRLPKPRRQISNEPIHYTRNGHEVK